MKSVHKIVIGVGIVGIVAAIIAKFSRSQWATDHGVSNFPDNAQAAVNIFKRALEDEPTLTKLLQEFEPGATFTSCYRNAVVNTGVGGVPNSKHHTADALDYGIARSVECARWLARPENRIRLPASVSVVLAETTPLHVHFEFFAAGEAPAPVRFRYESGGNNNFIPLT